MTCGMLCRAGRSALLIGSLLSHWTYAAEAVPPGTPRLSAVEMTRAIPSSGTTTGNTKGAAATRSAPNNAGGSPGHAGSLIQRNGHASLPRGTGSMPAFHAQVPKPTVASPLHGGLTRKAAMPPATPSRPAAGALAVASRTSPHIAPSPGRGALSGSDIHSRAGNGGIDGRTLHRKY
jgi:hypothetical protein